MSSWRFMPSLVTQPYAIEINRFYCLQLRFISFRRNYNCATMSRRIDRRIVNDWFIFRPNLTSDEFKFCLNWASGRDQSIDYRFEHNIRQRVIHYELWRPSLTESSLVLSIEWPELSGQANRTFARKNYIEKCFFFNFLKSQQKYDCP